MPHLPCPELLRAASSLAVLIVDEKRSPKRLKTSTGFEAAQKRKLGPEKRKAFRKEGGAAKTLTEAPGSF